MDSRSLFLLGLGLVSVLKSSVGSLDICLPFLLGIFRKRETIQQFVQRYINRVIIINSAKSIAFSFAILQLCRYLGGLKRPNSPTDEFLTKPMLFPCRTAHTRLFPKTHSFSYSYLLAGIPVGWKGSVGGMLSGDCGGGKFPFYSRWLSFSPWDVWFTVNGDDYLGRGHLQGGLEEKLHVFLKSQNASPKDYPYAYLLTAPRFLGYSSNPVSIWNLYSAEKELTATILEVNNTFDERHSYFLKKGPPNPTEEQVSDISKKPRFSKSWPKDFYVSVFNSRNGFYSLSASDPFFPLLTGNGNINSTVTLSSSHGNPKLIARVFSTSPGMDPTSMSVIQKTTFLLSWWWVGLATFPRTVVQAITILIKPSLSWVFRPEPRKNTIPRHANVSEEFIEPIFRRYLLKVVECNDKPVILTYTPAGLLDTTPEIMLSPSAQLLYQNQALGREVVKVSPEVKLTYPDLVELELRVLTPIFYSRFVGYQQSFDAFLSESQHGSATISILNIAGLSKIGLCTASMSMDGTDSIHFEIVRYLRSRPAPIENVDKKAGDSEITDWKKERDHDTCMSELDNFVLSSASSEQANGYTSCLTKMFVSEYVAFGWLDILDLEAFVVRCGVAYCLARVVFGWF